MSSLLQSLSDEQTWAAFREYKSKHSHMSGKEFQRLDEFIEQKRYLEITRRLGEPNHGFSIPRYRVINKSGTRKKRVIYTFPPDETWVLKLLTWLLYKYDDKLCKNCFSFRRNLTVKDAMDRVLSIPNLRQKYTLKVDIRNYFNSMPIQGMREVLKTIIDDDEELLRFLVDFLSVDKAVCDDQIRREPRGAMAGVPISAFMANIYLTSLDREFEEMGISYFRYSDDILILTESEEQRDRCKDLLERRIQEKGLSLNPDKVVQTDPGHPWEFLGFAYNDGKIDLSSVTIAKMKAKMKRKCRALYRWRQKKEVDFDRAAKVVIRVFNQKFYDVDERYDFTWSRWFFPVLTTDKGLHVLDQYLVSELRYIYSGRHYKGNYAVSYNRLKFLGFRSLVNEYHTFKKTGKQST